MLLAVPSAVNGWANDACRDLVALYESASTVDPDFQREVMLLANAWANLGSALGTYDRLADTYLEGDESRWKHLLDAELTHLVAAVRGLGHEFAASYRAMAERGAPAKVVRMRRIEKELGSGLSRADLLANMETALRAPFYMALRQRYNIARRGGRFDARRTADFFFLREFCYAAMFRFNRTGDFNVPYGGLTYNGKSFSDKVDRLYDLEMLKRLRATTWRSRDFEPFLAEAAPAPADFVFVDPPYDSDFSTYDGRPFGAADQERLSRLLASLQAKVMVVIKDTPTIRRLYGSDQWRLTELPKAYMWTIKSRNNRRTTHLTITNY